jgi:nitrous oxidase accessory protein NosD
MCTLSETAARPLGGLVLACVVAGLSRGPVVASQLPVVVPTAGMTIDRSVRLQPGTYRLPAPGDGPALTIKGDGVSVDLTGVTLEGGDPLADPDGYHGTGILVDASRDVTVRGASIRGYKVGLLGRRSPHLHLTGSDLSYNWKPRLWSGIEKESLVDWLTYHQNDQDEWLRYGAAIYLAECDGAEIDNTRAVQGQNGLLVTRSARLTIWNNTFSWMSGLGLGLYRTTDSTIMHNRLDWDVRGYSHGFYSRGQDSAALLMYEQSSGNLVARNSATHGGDGLFLWAGQSTMDTGRGGANDNTFVANDFSHAVANGIEATFSRNQFIANRLEDCAHGVWGGYSFESLFEGNTFARNTEAISIEHGQNIRIVRNRFDGDDTAIHIWANATQDPNWGYPKTRDTRSRDYTITENTFQGHKTAVSLSRTTGVTIAGNHYDRVGVLVQAGIAVAGLAVEPPFEPPPPSDERAPARLAPPLPGGVNALLPEGARRGRDTIIVDEWGPYDYRSPKLWPAGKPADRPLTLRVLGPAGHWILRSIRGAAAAAPAGVVPGELIVTPAGRGLDFQVTLEYVGADVVTPRGAVVPAATPVAVSYAAFEPAIDWAVAYWRFDDASDPIKAPEAFAARLREAPLKTEVVPRLAYLSSGAFAPGVPAEHVALRADGVVHLPPGACELTVVSDDGVRVWIDDRLAIDRWSVHESVLDRAPVSGGRHRVRVEYFQATGWAELQVKFRRR